MDWLSSCGFPGSAALGEALLTEGPERGATPAVVCGGLASTEEGFAGGMEDTPARASLAVTQTADNHHSGILIPHFKAGLQGYQLCELEQDKILNYSEPQFLQLQNGDHAACL